jgi:hypothetical protein
VQTALRREVALYAVATECRFPVILQGKIGEVSENCTKKLVNLRRKGEHILKIRFSTVVMSLIHAQVLVTLCFDQRYTQTKRNYAFAKQCQMAPERQTV